MSNPIKVMTIFGTRPEAVKMAPVVLELEKHSTEIESIVTVTAQHREMLDQVLNIFNIVPDYDLNIMKDRQTLTNITTEALQGLDDIMKNVQPDFVFVHGDTTTSFVASLAALYNRIAVGHVEAGLRTWDKYSPFPEETNRNLTGVIADLHFAPTETAAQNLLNENKPRESIYVTGNTVIDALNTTVRKDYAHSVVDKIKHNRFILLTAHRRENLGEPMRNIFRSVKNIVDEHEDVQVVYPVHLNSAVRDIAYDVLGQHSRIHLIEPLDVIDFHNIVSQAYMVLTDSGGIQEEASSLGIPLLVLRNTSERPEGIEAGTMKLAGTDETDIYNMTKELLVSEEAHSNMSKAINPYGDGHAAQRIVQAVWSYYHQ
ncbi:non-hydrolyzing UDP-N-acetylglucosamine 2-epimerase [Tuberibacillus sp. Marseille-P3662]|uniref:non-hydrolyzing UDP-N-acetylglucosamine 2-epimerase n=1 Tax=Tuberibacillus sp. Marseille-P3662 TaxID=1965358 RepID=UPI000A1CADC7|nr:UDP-N-acetylglucosamine 2-epimerase (non-hydrolyzing) [Tuberibacillus sp. Marseille-P3662]